jgi:hypothetical protein
MPYPTCRHILENGYFCQSPALKKRDYCFFHQEFRARRMKMARARARGEHWWLDLPCIEDMRSCQAAISRVIEGMAAKVIEPDHAKLLLSWLRLASSNFKARKAWEVSSDYENDRSFKNVADYTFEADHDLPEDFDLDQDPLQAFPMPEAVPEPLAKSEGRTAKSVLQDAETPIPGVRFEITADDMELMEVQEREGEAAMMKRAAVLERNRQRRERCIQRARYEELARNRNIQLAAQKLVLDQQRAAQAEADAAGAQATAAATLNDQHSGAPLDPGVGLSGTSANGEGRMANRETSVGLSGTADIPAHSNDGNVSGAQTDNTKAKKPAVSVPFISAQIASPSFASPPADRAPCNGASAGGQR